MMDKPEPILKVTFFRTETGREPVREWLKSLPPDERRIIGEDIKTVQFGWPLGMPLVRKLEADLWEVRSRLPGRTARILFTCTEARMVPLHGFIKKSQKTPQEDLELAKNTPWDVKVGAMNKQHLGSDFDDFLKEEGILAECGAVAHKRVVTWQIEREMKRRRISRAKLASRMNTSRATLDRLFAEEDSPVSLQLLEKAALALGRKLKVELA